MSVTTKTNNAYTVVETTWTSAGFLPMQCNSRKQYRSWIKGRKISLNLRSAKGITRLGENTQIQIEGSLNQRGIFWFTRKGVKMIYHKPRLMFRNRVHENDLGSSSILGLIIPVDLQFTKSSNDGILVRSKFVPYD